MKTKIKRHSRSVISVLLAVCMIFSCMTAAMIATDAAKTEGETVGANADSESVGSASADYGENRKYLYIDFSGYSNKANFQGIDFFWDGSNNNPYNKVGYIAKADMTVVATDIYRADLSTVTQYYSTLSGIQIIFTNTTDKWNQTFDKRSTDNNNCLKLSDASWSTEFNLWYGSSDTALNDKEFLAPGGIDFPLTTSNTFINVVNAAYDSWNSAGSVWNSTDKIGDMIASDDNIIIKEKKDQSSSTYYALIRAKNSTAAKYSQVLTYSKDDRQLTITSTAPPTYNITVNNPSDCTIRAEHGGVSKRNGETFTGLFEDDTVNITVTPKNSSDKVTAISATGEGNTVTPVVDNGNGTYRATLTVKATGEISAAIGAKSSYTVNYSVAAAPAGHGNVSAKLQDGTPVSSGTSVLEGTKVIFTATPEDGYGFAGWTGTFSTLLSPYTATISTDTTVVASFQLDGYELYYKDGTAAVNMTEMDNGWYVSSAKITKDKLFTLFRNGNSTYVDSENGNSAYEFNSTWLGPDKNLKWISGNGQFYKTTAADQYLLYDPFSNTLWVTTEPDGLFSSYEVYIKDGTVRGEGNNWGGYSADYGTTTLDTTDTTSGVSASPVNNYGSHVKKITLTAEQVRAGVNLHIKTEVKTNYQSKYYVKGFDVNGGLTQGVISQEFGDGGSAIGAGDYNDASAGAKIHNFHSNDFILSFDSDNLPDPKVEVTPIYFPLANNESDFVRFYAYDFTEDVKKDWGGSLAVYPYIRDTYYPYGAYPGQLMVNEGGVYYADIPKEDTSGGTPTPIQGLTMNNYVWDTLHYNLFYGSDQADNNWQTYDYNEFAVINDILQHKAGYQNEDIIFSFKYKETVDRDKSNLGESTYYVDSDINDATRAKDYRNGFQTIEVNDSQYHWEDLTDFYGNKVDIFGALVETTGNKTKKGYNPIRIVSNGYDDNKVGYYATAWALYKPVDASGNNAWTGTVDHYELFDVIGGQGKEDRSFQSESFLIARDSQNQVRMKYDETFHNAHQGEEGYPQSELIIDGALVPAQITYEYNIKSDMSNIDTGDHQMAYRSDGRWYYSNSNQLIKANAIVEVANSKKGPFTRDYFQGNNYDYKSGDYYNPALNTGLSTSTKAYFTNNDSVDINSVIHQNVNGNTQAYAISDGDHTFKMKAEEDSEGNYEFIGWYRLTESGAGVGYTLASEDLEFETEAKTNDVYVARFVKVPSGNLVVSHTLTGEIGKNEVDCKAKVEVLTSAGTLDSTGNTIVYTYPETTANIKVTSKYIKYDNDHKDQKLRITLETTSQKEGKFLFDKFWEKVTSETMRELEAQGVLAQVSITNNKAIILVNIGSLFDTSDLENPVQNVNSLPFFSSVKLPQISYKLDYTYESAIGKNTQYGEQSVHVEDYFTDTEFAKYVVWDDELVTDDSGGSKEGGWYKFNPETYVEFLASKCPYEKNIRRDLTWDYTQITKVNNGPWYYYNQGQFKFAISASDPLQTTKRINFIFPYYVLEYDDDDYYLKNDQGLIEMLDEESAPSKQGLNKYGEEVNFSKYLEASTKFATPYTKSNSDVDSFVKAPEIIYDCSDAENPVPKYFQYWSVQTVPSNNASYNPEDYTNRRYEVARCYNLAYNFSAYQDYIVEAKYGDTRSTHTHLDSATITFAENGRNQWNKLQGSAKWDQGDRIFSNFIISFDRADKIQLNTLGAGDPNIKTGVVFEQLDTLSDFNQRYMNSGEGDWTVQSEMTYFQKYSCENTLEAAEAADHGKDDAIKHIKGEATTVTHTYMDSTIKNTNIDNKNRIEFTKAFANINTTNFAPTTRKNYVYRAYAYMQEADGSVTISTPVYFQFYDIATIANATRQTTPAITG